MSTETPSQTIGPFFAVLLPFASNELVPPGAPDAIELRGRVTDGAGAPVADALIELWQANEFGRYANPADDRELPLREGFSGFGRCPTNERGEYRFVTVLPGAVPYDSERHQAPHLSLTLFARGLLRELRTRVYFAGEPRNAHDPVLGELADDARATLIAAAEAPGVFRFDIRLQGERETQFFVF